MPIDPPQQPRIAILDYGMGNLRSVHRAFLAVGAEACLVEHPVDAEKADALVFPGQGAITDTMHLLKARGWDGFIRDWIKADRSFFGICLGLQALFEYSEEGQSECLGIFPGVVRRFRFPLGSGFKIPHMGWNSVRFADVNEPLLKGIDAQQDQFYFVHSYYVDPAVNSFSWAATLYGDLEFCSGIKRGNLVATQFHPEKSQKKGLRLYRNFLDRLKIDPSCS